MKILIYHRRAQEYSRLIHERFPKLEVVAGHDEEFLSQHIADAEIMLAFQFPLKVLSKATRLRWIQLTSAGSEQVLDARESLQGVVITNTRGIHAGLMADYAFGAIFMLQWDFPTLFFDQQAKKWGYKAIEPLAEKTLGIVGVGAIGREIARRAQLFGLNVIGVKRNPVSVEEVSRIFGPGRLQEALSLSDFVVLVVPLTPETYRMIGESELHSMKQTGYLINISRGSIIEESALIKALQEKWIAGAVLDVFEKEPLSQDSPLWKLPNVMITPHIAGELQNYPVHVMGIFEDNLKRWKSGLPLRNQVDLVRGY